MRGLRTTCILLALAGVLFPEVPRYAAERHLYQAASLLRIVFTQPRGIADPAGALEWAARTAAAVAGDLPGDPRPPSLAAAARLLVRQPERALACYGDALALGERPEIDLNLGRAYALLGRAEDARAAFLRAGWVSPAVLASLPAAVQGPLRIEVARLEQELRAGRLTAPPPLPR